MPNDKKETKRNYMPENIKHLLDAVSYGTLVAAITNVLPPLAALLSVIWLSIQIYDRLKHGPKK